MIELEYHYSVIPNELMDLNNVHQLLLTSEGEKTRLRNFMMKVYNTVH